VVLFAWRRVKSMSGHLIWEGIFPSPAELKFGDLSPQERGEVRAGAAPKLNHSNS
jgi:hypothetical protein